MFRFIVFFKKDSLSVTELTVNYHSVYGTVTFN